MVACFQDSTAKNVLRALGKSFSTFIGRRKKGVGLRASQGGELLGLTYMTAGRERSFKKKKGKREAEKAGAE